MLQYRSIRIGLIVMLSIVILALIATMIISYIVGMKLTHPARHPVVDTPAEVQLSYRNIEFPSRVDHISIKGWLIPAAKRTRSIVIEAHGYRENRSDVTPILPVAKALHDAGYAVMLFDFRDEGSSGGKKVSIGEFETRDLTGAADYAKSLGYDRIGVIGYSMGASTALEAAADDNDFKAVVADSPFANLHSYLNSHMSHWTHLPSFPFNPELFLEMRLFTGINSFKVNPLSDLKHWHPRPLLLIAGTADAAIPMQTNAMKLYQEVKGNPDDSLWVVPQATHVGAYEMDSTAYKKKIVQFFERWLS